MCTSTRPRDRRYRGHGHRYRGRSRSSLAATLFRAAGGPARDPGAAEPHSPAPTRRSGRPVTTLFTITPSTRRRSASRPRLNAPVVHTLHLPPDAAIAAALGQAARGAAPPAVACVSRVPGGAPGGRSPESTRSFRPSADGLRALVGGGRGRRCLRRPAAARRREPPRRSTSPGRPESGSMSTATSTTPSTPGSRSTPGAARPVSWCIAGYRGHRCGRRWPAPRS